MTSSRDLTGEQLARLKRTAAGHLDYYRRALDRAAAAGMSPDDSLVVSLAQSRDAADALVHEIARLGAAQQSASLGACWWLLKAAGIGCQGRTNRRSDDLRPPFRPPATVADEAREESSENPTADPPAST